MRLKPYKSPKLTATKQQRGMMAKFSGQSISKPAIYTPQLGLNMGMDASGGKVPPTPPQAATPTFNPVAGTYTSVQSVTISTATSGATIRYTTDGSTPTETHGTVYSGPVSVATSETLKAIAYAVGYTDSNVASAAYTINLWSPATQFSSLIFWVDAKQAISGSDYDSSTKALVSWKNQATVTPANNLIPIADTPPVFEAAGLLGNPDFYYDPAAHPVDCGIAYSPAGNGFLPFGSGFGYTGPIFRSYVLQVQFDGTASNAYILTVPGVGQINAENYSGPPVEAGGVDACLEAHFNSDPYNLSPAWVGPIFQTNSPVTLLMLEGRTTADGSQRRLYCSIPAEGSIPAFFAAIKQTGSTFGPDSLSPNGSAILFGPNDAHSKERFSECVLALDDPSAGGLDSNLSTMAAGQLLKWSMMPKPIVLCVGDSLTGGTGGDFNLTQAQYWPYLVGQSKTGSDFLNVGINSRTALALQSDEPAYPVLFRPIVSNTAFIWAGTNDIDAAASTAAGSYANLSTLVGLFKAAGWTKTVVMTCIPRNWASFGSGGGGSDAERAAFNALVLANSAGADLVIDPTTLAPFSTDTSWLDGTYYQNSVVGIGVHLTPLGQSTLATYIASLL